jgi:hypothetical protein
MSSMSRTARAALNDSPTLTGGEGAYSPTMHHFTAALVVAAMLSVAAPALADVSPGQPRNSALVHWTHSVAAVGP